MDIMQNIDLEKVISILAEKDQKLKQAMSMSTQNAQFMSELFKARNKEIKQVKDRAQKESRLKEDAITKLEELRSEVQLLQGEELN